MTIISWRMLTAATVCLIILASLGATAETYDEMPPGDMSLMYPAHNFMDLGHQASVPETKDENSIEGLLLYKMLTAIRNQDVSPNVLAGPKWISTGTVLVPPEPFDISLLKDSMKKRVSDVDSNVTKTSKQTKPVQKWKNKKGRVGSQMICYFKLCAFRPPNK